MKEEKDDTEQKREEKDLVLRPVKWKAHRGAAGISHRRQDGGSGEEREQKADSPIAQLVRALH